MEQGALQHSNKGNEVAAVPPQPAAAAMNQAGGAVQNQKSLAAERQNGLGGPSAQPPAATRPKPKIRASDGIALSLNATDPALPQSIRKIIVAASSRWLVSKKLKTVLEYFCNLQQVDWPTRVAIKPSGKIFL